MDASSAAYLSQVQAQKQTQAAASHATEKPQCRHWFAWLPWSAFPPRPAHVLDDEAGHDVHDGANDNIDTTNLPDGEPARRYDGHNHRRSRGCTLLWPCTSSDPWLVRTGVAAVLLASAALTALCLSFGLSCSVSYKMPA